MKATVALLFLLGTAVASAQTASLPLGPNRDLVQTACGSCHTLNRVTKRGRGPEEWAATVLKMKRNGLVLSDRDAEKVLEYLATALGPKTVKTARR